jgi:hypothetical protein
VVIRKERGREIDKGNPMYTPFRVLGNRSISLVKHAYPVPCVEGVSLGDKSTCVKGACGRSFGNFDFEEIRFAYWNFGIVED